MPSGICILDTTHRLRLRKPAAGTAVFGTLRATLDHLRRKQPHEVWIAVDTESLKRLVQAIAKLSQCSVKRALVSLERPSFQEFVALGACFSPILPSAAAKVSLEELAVILAERRPQDFCIAVDRDQATRTLTLWRGDLSRLVVPLAFLPRRTDAVPDPECLAILDHGQTIRLGNYETSFDAILYMRDREYRLHARRRLRASDRSLGGCIRRLRKQKALRQSDFPDVPARTIARIENGESPTPHGATLAKIAEALGVEVGELSEF